MSTLIEILEESVKRHGETFPLTLGHLLNIVKLADRVDESRTIQMYEKELFNDAILKENCEVEGQ